MNFMTIFSSILMLLAGIGVFLVACKIMSDNLESLSSDRLKLLFQKANKNKWIGVGIGAAGTAAIQSSGAMTVMVIGFVNVGIMSLTQAATIIYGANIGTTITAQIVALGMFGTGSISSTIIFAAFAGIGAFVNLFAKQEKSKIIGNVLAGFGMLFVGLSMMEDSMNVFAQAEEVKLFLAGINNPLVLVLLGTIFTAIIQSSSVMTSIALTMVVAGLINIEQGIFLTMGSNIGSCVVALIAGMTSGLNAKRTSLIHLFFNVSGVVIFMIINMILELFTGGSWSMGNIFADLFPSAPQVQLAMFHTFFNVITVLLMLPLTEHLVNFVCKLIPEPLVPVEQPQEHLHFLDEKMLGTPVFAITQFRYELENMSQLAISNFGIAMDAINYQDFSQEELFWKNENEMNYLNHTLASYSIRLSEKKLNEQDSRYVASTFRTVADLERIGDYAKNIVEFAHILQENGESFSAEVQQEVEKMRRLVIDVSQYAIKAYMNKDQAALDAANQIEDQVDELTQQMEDNYVQRLGKKEFNAIVGAQYLSLAQNAERISDHLINVAKTIRDW